MIHTEEEWQKKLSEYGGRCAYRIKCNGDVATERDHVLAVSLGGSDEIDNIAPSCRPCNASKGSLRLWEWIAG